MRHTHQIGLALRLCALGALLAGADLLKAGLADRPVLWWWLAISAAIWIALVGALVGGRRWRIRLVEAISRMSSSAVGSPAVAGRRARRVLAVSVIAMAVVGATAGSFAARFAGTRNFQYDAEAALVTGLAWHRGGSALPAEPRPTAMVAGLLGGGDTGRTVIAGRLVSLLAAALLVGLVALVAGARRGATAAAIAAAAVFWDITQTGFKMTEDATFALMMLASVVVLMRVIDRPRWWPLFGALAGLTISIKGVGVCLLVTFALALAFDRRLCRATLPHLVTTLAALLIVVSPLLVWVLQGEPTKGTQLAGLLALHVPEAQSAMWNLYSGEHCLPAFPGLRCVVYNRLGLMTVGDFATSAFIGYAPRAWILVAAGLGAIAARARPEGRVLLAHLITVTALLGLLGWKLGDSADPFFTLGPIAALVLAEHGAAWARNLGVMRTVIWSSFLFLPTIAIFVWRTAMMGVVP